MPEIVILQGFKRFHLIWEQIYVDARCKRFKVTPLSNLDKYLVLENNEPLIRGRYHLKHRRVDWKQLEGEPLRQNSLEAIIREIENPSSVELPKLPVPKTPTPSRRKRQAPITLLKDRPKS